MPKSLTTSTYFILAAAVWAMVPSNSWGQTMDRPSEACPGAIETVNLDNDGAVIGVAAVTVPSNATATCITNPGVIVEMPGDGSTLVNNVQGLRVTSSGTGNTVTNAGSFPFVIMNGDGATINNNVGATVSGADVGLAALGNDGTIKNDGSVAATGESSVALGIQGDRAEIINTGTASSEGEDSTAIGASGIDAQIENSGTATASGKNATAIFVEGDNAIINTSGTAEVSTDNGGVTAVALEGNKASAINSGTIKVDVKDSGSDNFGLTGVGNDATLINTGEISVVANGGAAMGAVGDDNTLVNEGKITTVNFPGVPGEPASVSGVFGMGAVGGRGVEDKALSIVNNGEIQTAGEDAHGIVLGLTSFGSGTSGPSEGQGTNRGTISTSGNNSDGMQAFANDSELQNLGSISIGSAESVQSAGIRGKGNHLRLINGSPEPGGGSASITAVGNGEISSSVGSTGMHGIVLEGSASQVENYGNISVINNIGDSITSAGDLSTAIKIGARTLGPGDTGDASISEEVEIAGLVVDDVKNTVINGGIVEATSRILGQPNRGISIFVDRGTGIIENLAGGQLNDGIIFNDGTSGIVTNSGFIGEGILDVGPSLGTGTMGPVAVEINNQAGGTIAGNQGEQAILISQSRAVQLNNAGTIRDAEVGTDTVVGILAEKIGVTNAGLIEGLLGVNGETILVQNLKGGVIRSTSGTNPALGIGSGFELDLGSETGEPVEVEADSIGVSNAGTIEGLAVAVRAATFVSDLRNGIALTNEETGFITSPAIAVDFGMDDKEDAPKRNDVVDNMGTIRGDVYLGAGDDTFIHHDESTLDGLVFGGLGADHVIAEFDGDGTFNGDLYSEFADLTKTGGGRLEFEGSLAVNQTTVQDGSFMMQEGSSLISSVSVNEGATIGGSNATVFGNITGDGMIAPGLSIGRLDVVGDIDFGGIFEFEIGGTEDFDFLNIDGDLTLNAAEFRFLFLEELLFEDFASISFLDISGSLFGFESSAFAFLDFQGNPIGGDFNVMASAEETGGFFFSLFQNEPPTSVPEPGTLALFIIGLVGIWAARRRRGKRLPEAYSVGSDSGRQPSP